MKYILDKIYPGSVFRLFFFITLVIAGLFSLLFLISSVFFGYLLISVIIFVIGVPLLALFVGFAGFIYTWIYTGFARKFGGIKVDLKKDEV